MAFRRFRRRRTSFARGRRRQNPYELAQISVCRKAIAMGLTDCNLPDQMFTCLVSYNEWMANTDLSSGAGVSVRQSLAAHAGKSITVRGIQFDYQYSMVPRVDIEADPAIGAVSIRSALLVMKVNAQGSGGEDDFINPAVPPINLLFRTQALRSNIQTNTTVATVEEAVPHYRTLWRGMEVANTITIASTSAVIADLAFGTVPLHRTQSRHVRVRTACRLQRDEALFFVTEAVNPFVSGQPNLGLDLFGSVAIKTNFTGPVRYDVTGA